MRRALAVAAFVVLLATAVANAGTKAADACKPGTHKIGTVTYRVFCGPASATVKTGGKTYTFRNGTCLRAGITRVFTMSIGRLATSKGKPKYSYFGIIVPSANHDGVYRRALVTWVSGGKRYALANVKVRLTNKQSRGSFSGRTAGKRTTVTGSFRCK
jgi:hypothetical protein